MNKKVEKILETFNEKKNQYFAENKRIVKELQKIGYTVDYDLDGTFYALHELSTLEEYQKSIHEIYTEKKVISPTGQIFDVYKSSVNTYAGSKKSIGGVHFIINGNHALSRTAKKGVINFIKNN